MKRIAALLLLGVLSLACSLPAAAQRENRSIGENGQEARRAAKQQRKYSKKMAKKHAAKKHAVKKVAASAQKAQAADASAPAKKMTKKAAPKKK